MTRAILIILVPTLCGALAAAAPGPALAPGSRLWLDGDSTLHAFTCSTTVIGWDMALAAGQADPARAVREGRVAALAVTVPVASLRSGKSGLDRNLRSALDATRHPDITFRLIRIEPAAPGATLIAASGELTIAGASRPVAISAGLAPAAGGLRLAGRHELLMTAFGVTPPVLMFGALKVRDRIVVSFDLTLDIPRRDHP